MSSSSVLFSEPRFSFVFFFFSFLDDVDVGVDEVVDADMDVVSLLVTILFCCC